MLMEKWEDVTTTDFSTNPAKFYWQKNKRRKSIVMIHSSDILLWFLKQTQNPNRLYNCVKVWLKVRLDIWFIFPIS